MDEKLLRTLEKLNSSSIIVAEWETPLLNRLGYPLAIQPRWAFLVPDTQLEKADSIVTGCGLQAIGHDKHRPQSLSDFVRLGTRYRYGARDQEGEFVLLLLPMSWASLEIKDLQLVSTSDLYHAAHSCPIWTVPLPAFCTAYLRIATKEPRKSRARQFAIEDLAGVIAYGILGKAYEGTQVDLAHAERNGVWVAKDDDELEQASAKIRAWNLGTGNEWVSETLVSIISGNLHPRDLPCEEL